VRRSSWRSWLPFIFLVTAILLLALHETQILLPVENALQTVFAPLQRGVAGLVSGLGNVFETIGETRELRAEVEELRQRVDALTAENIRLREHEAAEVQLRSMLNFVATNPTWTFVGADVVGQSACLNSPCGEIVGYETNPYLRYIMINAGSADGVGLGMPVVTGGAVLIGRIAEVSTHTSKVQLLNDTASNVAVFLQQSRATGLVAGQADGSLRLGFVPHEETIAEGEIVLTSGLGGVLPRGLVVGQVSQVIRQDFALFQEAVVRPAADYQRVELVLIITHFQPFVEEETGTQE